MKKIIEKTEITQEQYKEAKQITNERKIPFGDALHAIISRDTGSILITRDKHFQEIREINKPYKPEELL